MRGNFPKRIFTSILLLIILSLGLLVNKYLWLFLLIISSIISFKEFNNLIKKIFYQKKIIYLSNIISSLYLVLFTFAAYNIYNVLADLIFILLICIFSDTGGFIIGKLIGGKKLTKISPNKTISGSIGSFIFSLFPMFAFSYIYDYLGNSDFFINLSMTLLFSISLFLSFVCQIGDLFISYFKRKANVKNTGSILPGHGGLLDRIDGVIFVLPITYIIDKLLL